MAIRSNHYEAAFEAFLRQRRCPYVAVDESRRTLLAESSLKSLDFIVYSAGTANLLIDIKGRKFPTGNESGHTWENWIEAEDVSALLTWESVFGGGFRSVLVFAYYLRDPRYLEQHSDRWTFRDRTYAFYGIWAGDYAVHMRRRSPRWDTMFLHARDFTSLRMPFSGLI